jgi:hypothetical protein
MREVVSLGSRDRGLVWKAMVLAYSDLGDGYRLRGAT